MDQPAGRSRTEDPDIEAGAGGNVNGGSLNLNWTQKVKLKIHEEAKGVPELRRFEQADSRPSIFRPRRQEVAAPVLPVIAHTLSQPQPQPTSSRSGSTGGDVIVAAVGPYHKSISSERLIITRAKKCAIVEFLALPEFGLDIDDFLAWARDNDARARGCYEPDDSLTAMPAEELAEMHLLDGCLVLFAVFLLRKWSPRKGQRGPYPSCLAADISVSTASTRTRCRTKLAQDFINLSADISQNMKQTRLDLLLLGNQIPFFLLQELHRRLEYTFFSGIKRSIEELALSCFDDIRPCPGTRSSSPPTQVHHLLHLFHWSRVPPGKHAVDPSAPPLLGEPESNLPCATWFEDSHIGFRSTHAASSPGTLHMDFRRSMLGARGVLRVPALHIHGYSALVFHNLIAFEQRHLRCGLGATTYCICMARLLQSEADAKLLRRSGILAHTHETDEEIVALFRGLAQEYCQDAYYSRDLLDLCGDVEAHRHSRAARAVNFVKLQCFPRQTVTFFVILGALISIATLVNTVVSVYRFYHPYINQTTTSG